MNTSRPPWHRKNSKGRTNWRGGMSKARVQAMKDITQHLWDTAPDLPWAGPRSCEVGHYCITPSQILSDPTITPLNRQLGL